MSIETIAIVLIVIALIWTNLGLRGRITILEYRHLLVTEALATMEGGKDSAVVAKQARDEINKKYWLIDKIAQS